MNDTTLQNGSREVLQTLLVFRMPHISNFVLIIEVTLIQIRF